MPEGNPKPDLSETNPEKLAQLLELELMQKRASWQRAQAGRRNLRLLAFLFLMLVIAGALVGFYLLFSGGELRESRDGTTERPAAAESPR